MNNLDFVRDLRFSQRWRFMSRCYGGSNFSRILVSSRNNTGVTIQKTWTWNLGFVHSPMFDKIWPIETNSTARLVYFELNLSPSSCVFTHYFISELDP